MGFFSSKSKKQGRATISGLPTPDPRHRLGHHGSDDDSSEARDARYSAAELTAMMVDQYGDFEASESVRPVLVPERAHEDELFQAALGLTAAERDAVHEWGDLDPWDGLPSRRSATVSSPSRLSSSWAAADDPLWTLYEDEAGATDVGSEDVAFAEVVYEEIYTSNWHPSESLIETLEPEVDDFAPMDARIIAARIESTPVIEHAPVIENAPVIEVAPVVEIRTMPTTAPTPPTSTVVMSVINVKGPSETLLEAFAAFERASPVPEGQLVRCVVATSDGIAIHDVWESRHALQAWVATTPGSPSPLVTPVRSIRIQELARTAAG